MQSHEIAKVDVEGKIRLAQVLAHYDLGTLRTCERIEHGYVNETWTVEMTAGRYVVKRRHPDLCETRLILGQHALVKHLGVTRFPAPQIIPTRRGASFVELDREIYEAQEYASGALCDPAKPAHQKTAAYTLGWYHLAVDGFDHPAFHWSCERYGTDALARILEDLDQEWQGRLTPELARLYEALWNHADDLRACCKSCGSLPELVIHGDFYAENLILEGNAISAVVDYDLAHWCARVTELAEALIYFARKPQKRFEHIVYPGVLDLGKIERFLEAYLSVVDLTPAEIRALPLMIRIIWLCASLNPPMRPRLSVEEAPQALPEVLGLADWAEAHTPEIVKMGFAVQSVVRGTRRCSQREAALAARNAVQAA